MRVGHGNRAPRCIGVALLLTFSWGAAAQARNNAVIGVQLEPPVLDPTSNPAAPITEIVYGNVYEGLVQFAADGSVRPALATAWEISADGLIYTFHLRRGVRFHDGTAFDAATAKFSLDRALAPGSSNPQKERLQAVHDVAILDPSTLRITLARRSGGLLQSLAWAAFVMVAPSSAASDAVHPVGTGPFRFQSWLRGDSLRLGRNPDYWGPAARLDGATFKFIADPTAAYAALMAGDVDAFSNYPAPESFAQFTADRRFAVTVGQTEGETVLAFNERRAPFDNLLVRRAISHALDRAAIIDGAMFGYGVPIGSHFPPQNPDYVDLTGLYPHDVVAAKSLLAAAGYPNGFSVSLKLPPPAYARRAGEIVAAQLAVLGIKVRIENLEWAQWLSQVFARHDYDLSIVAHAEPMDYDIYARDDYYFGYSNPQFKALIAALEDTNDATLRRSLLQQIQRTLAHDAVNGFLFEYPKLDVRSVHLLGLASSNLLGAVDLGQAHFDAGADAAAAGRSADAASEAVDLTQAAGRAPGFYAFVVLLAAVAGMLVFTAARRFGPMLLLRRLAVLAATLAAATAVVFIVVQIIPGDPARYMLGLQATPGSVAALQHVLGIDGAPLPRYVHWVTGLLHGEFGISYTYRVPVGDLLAERMQVSLPLAVYAFLESVCIAFPAALWAVARRGRTADHMLAGLARLGLAVPNFWLAMLLTIIFAIDLRWVSAGGFPGWSAGFWQGMRALSLPAAALAMPQAAILTLVLRSALLDTLHQDYIRTARAKGAGGRQVLWRHALPNSLIPVLTIAGLQFSYLLAGGVIIENIFYLPGLGRLVIQAIEQRDLIVVQSVVVILVFAVVSVTFLVDLSYALLDPRLRPGGGSAAGRAA
jgi:ABC-type dipeptide/oligopeptide/nickel transport system permease component/ABC-type transport system substrate-binding protein